MTHNSDILSPTVSECPIGTVVAKRMSMGASLCKENCCNCIRQQRALYARTLPRILPLFARIFVTERNFHNPATFWRDTPIAFITFLFSANDFPGDISDADSVPFGETFLLVGGMSGGANSDFIFMYSPTNDSWNYVEGRLESGKNKTTAMLVQTSMFSNC